ncbi:MAG: PEP-CTERM sorting domain-containing protein [Burkholderiales bacterium]
MKPGLAILALALALAAVPFGARASISAADTGDRSFNPPYGFPPAGAGASLPSSSPDRLPGSARKPVYPESNQGGVPRAEQVAANAASPDGRAMQVAYRIGPAAQSQHAPEPDTFAMVLVGLLGTAAIARRRLMP